MRKDAPYSYHLLVGDRQLGPYDRKTIVGMHIKKAVDHNLMVRRSDGHELTVAQLQADRFEMADGDSLKQQAASPPASGIWPTFLMNCGGSLMKPGAFGFIGRGELRFQGEYLRLTANRKSGLVSTRLERIKVPLSAIFAASAHEKHTKFLLLQLKAGHPLEGVAGGGSAMIALDTAEDVKELLELMNLS
jgi:hypothetical protein